MVKCVYKVFLISWIILGTSSFRAHSQDLELVTEVDIRQPKAVSLDRKGEILIADNSGTVDRYNSLGKKTQSFSADRRNPASMVEAWTTLDIMVFYDSYQTITLLDRFLTPISDIDLSPAGGFTRLATPAGQSQFWLLDDKDYLLTLYDARTTSISIRTPLNHIVKGRAAEFTFMREYQNLVFLAEASEGIMVFDKLGNYLRTIEAKEVNYFGFVDDQIYFESQGQLIFLNLYANGKSEIEVEKGSFHLASRDHLFSLTTSSLKIFKR